MQHTYTYNNQDFQFERYPETKDHSLKAFSNAEIYALNHIGSYKNKSIGLYNDRFGFWNTCLDTFNPRTIWSYHSQTKAIKRNLDLNGIAFREELLFDQFETINNPFDVVLLKVPKSLELFENYLEHIWQNANENTEIVCCFMTKYFTKGILDKANLFFEEVEQSLAWKKSRLVILKQPKSQAPPSKLKSIEFNSKTYKQYPGVFSSSHIDYATQFLTKYINVKPDELNVLDLASGNGVLAHFCQESNPEAQLTLIDDFHLAVESSKMNTKNANYICSDSLDSVEDQSFDLIVSNPPFHFEHENNIDITLNLMKNVSRCLKPKGRFLFVANNHLNYKTHLVNWFTHVYIVNKNEKFIILECSNA
ncbi:MAG: class I SAM-dependent methyltransferase [Flavobacteriales bacterium]